jgi:uncharacterized membrane protein (UPF0127 family)
MRAAILVLGALAACGCQRAPAEDFAPRVTAPSAAKADSAASATAEAARSAAVPAELQGRCIRATPAEPPPAVRPGPAAGCPADPENGGTPLREVTVRFPEGGATVQAEVAVSPKETERGLMYRRSMAEDRGMLFDLRTRSDHEFWMHNTCIPLDLLYVDADGLIVGIVENAPTLDDSPRSVHCPSRYVLEVNAGWSRRHGVKAGQQMSIPL